MHKKTNILLKKATSFILLFIYIYSYTPVYRQLHQYCIHHSETPTKTHDNTESNGKNIIRVQSNWCFACHIDFFSAHIAPDSPQLIEKYAETTHYVCYHYSANCQPFILYHKRGPPLI